MENRSSCHQKGGETTAAVVRQKISPFSYWDLLAGQGQRASLTWGWSFICLLALQLFVGLLCNSSH